MFVQTQMSQLKVKKRKKKLIKKKRRGSVKNRKRNLCRNRKLKLVRVKIKGKDFCNSQ